MSVVACAWAKWRLFGVAGNEAVVPFDNMPQIDPFDFFLNPYRTPKVCRECGAKDQEVWYTSTRDKTDLCRPCFETRDVKQLAKEAPVTKTNHPLDAWRHAPRHD